MFAGPGVHFAGQAVLKDVQGGSGPADEHRTSIAGEAPGTSNQRRDNERELVLKAQVGGELPVEQELERWFPLWGIPI